jgi:hypothetical protein
VPMKGRERQTGVAVVMPPPPAELNDIVSKADLHGARALSCRLDLHGESHPCRSACREISAIGRRHPAHRRRRSSMGTNRGCGAVTPGFKDKYRCIRATPRASQKITS